MILIDFPIKTKQDLIDEVVFYGNANINEDRFLSQQKIDFEETFQEFIDSDNDITFEVDKLNKFPLKSRNKDIFLLECSIHPNLKLYNKCIILKHWSEVKAKSQRYINITN